MSKNRPRIYETWLNMRRRCNDPKSTSYARYGGRGIKVCEEWQNSFKTFEAWAYTHGYTDELTIERIDVNGNYEPSNCTWITRSAQKNNTSQSVWIEINGVRKTMKTWAEENGIPYSTVLNRKHAGIDPKLAVTAKRGEMRKYSDEERGKKRITRAKVVLQYTKDGQYVGKYESARQAAHKLGKTGWSENSITNCCRGLSKSSYGYVWRYAE